MNESDFLKQSESIFAYTTEGILIVNERGVILRVNPSAGRIFGYQQGNLEGKRIEDLIPERYRRNHGNYRQQFHKESQPRSMGVGRDLYGLREDGSEFPVEISLSPFSNESGNYVVAFVIDITVRKDAEKKLIDYKNELEKLVEERTADLRKTIYRLEKTKRELDLALITEQELGLMKSRFVSIASHEFRTPLAAIMSSLSLVEKYADLKDIEKRDRHIKKIKNAVRNLTDILNDFLSLNRLEEGKVMVFSEIFPVGALLEELMHQMESIAKPDQVITLLQKGLPSGLVFSSDPKLIFNILSNLVSNAIKFSGPTDEVLVSASYEDDYLVLKVKDKGIGIPEDEYKHVFERFYRMRNAGEIQGTGLGLSIVSHHVSLLKGKVNFVSKENVGTEFTVKIPNQRK